jgi:hypothetical protein
MKPSCILLFILSLSLSFQLKGQIKKSALLVGGTVRLFTEKYNISIPQQDPIKQINVAIGPSVGKAIQDNLVAGIGLGYEFEISDNYVNTIQTKRNAYVLNLFIRQYMNVTRNFYLYLQGSLYGSYEINSVQRMSETEKTKGPEFGVDIDPGLSYALNNRLHLELAFSSLVTITYFTEDRLIVNPANITTTHSKHKSFGMQGGLNLSNSSNILIGFRLLLNRPKKN